MNAIFSPLTLRCLMLMILGLVGLAVLSCSASAAEPSAPFLQGNLVFEMVSNRSRMIQVSLVCVAFGCAIIWWYR